MQPLSYYVIENVKKNETKYRTFNLLSIRKVDWCVTNAVCVSAEILWVSIMTFVMSSEEGAEYWGKTHRLLNHFIKRQVFPHVKTILAQVYLINKYVGILFDQK